MRVIEQEADTAAHWSIREYDALFAPEAPKRIVFVAENEDGQLCGFAIARCSTGDWEIENVVVAAEFRLRGVGSALVGEILETARSNAATSVLLDVRVSNTAARALYTALGFGEMATRPGYYQNPPEDALMMGHRLGDRDKTA